MSTAATPGRFYTKILTSSAIYAVAVFAPMAISLVLLPVYTRYLTTSDYGVVDLLVTAQNLFGLLLGGRFADALFFFYAKADDDRKRQVVSTAMWGSILVGVLLALAGCIFAPLFSQVVFQNLQWTHYFRLAFVGLGLSLPLEAGLGWLRVVDQARKFVLYSIARLLVAVSFTMLLLVGLDWKIAGVLWSTLLTNGLLGLLIAVVCLRSVSSAFLGDVFWKMLQFSIPLGATGMALMIVHSGDRFFLQRYTTLAEIGLYSFAYRLGMLVSYVQAAFGTHWQAHVVGVIRAEDGIERFARVNTYQLVILTYVALGISVFSSPVLHLLVTPRFLECIPFIPWIAAVYLIRAEGDFFRSALYAEGRVGIDARLNWTSAVICLAAYALFIPKWQAWGAIAATGLAFTSSLLLSTHQTIGKASYRIEPRRVLATLVSGAGICIMVLWLETGSSVPLQWILALAGALAYPLILYAAGFFLPSEKAAAQVLLHRLREKINSSMIALH